MLNIIKILFFCIKKIIKQVVDIIFFLLKKCLLIRVLNKLGVFMPKKLHKAGVFVFAMMNVAIVLSLRGLPMIADTGTHMIFFILFASLLFLLPVSLVSAELATGWTKEGGVYRWVKEAFGSKLGFTAIWIQWVQNSIWNVTVLAFAAGALSYLFFDPTLAANRMFIVAVVFVVYWGAMFINFRGFKAASWFATVCVTTGTIAPAIIIIIFGLIWVLGGNPIEFLAQPRGFIPDLTNFNNVAFLAGTVLLFAGMEVEAVHVLSLKNPSKNYPKALFIALLIIALTFLLGSLAIAATLSPKDISLTAGVMQAIDVILTKYNLKWFIPIMGFLLAFGALGGTIAWIGGPSKGLLATAKYGELPPFLAHTNKHGVQTHILWIQAIIVTLLALVFLLLPNVNTAYYLLTSLTVVLYLVMYMLLYVTAIVLRYKKPNVKRTYKIPLGHFGMWCVAGIGFLAVLFAFTVGFFPPSQIKIANPRFYVWFLIIGVIVFVSAPIIINSLKRPSWKKQISKKSGE